MIIDYMSLFDAVNKRLDDLERKHDMLIHLFNEKNAENIKTNEDALVEIAEMLSEHDDAICELAEELEG